MPPYRRSQEIENSKLCLFSPLNATPFLDGSLPCFYTDTTDGKIQRTPSPEKRTLLFEVRWFSYFLKPHNTSGGQIRYVHRKPFHFGSFFGGEELNKPDVCTGKQMVCWWATHMLLPMPSSNRGRRRHPVCLLLEIVTVGLHHRKTEAEAEAAAVVDQCFLFGDQQARTIAAVEPDPRNSCCCWWWLHLPRHENVSHMCAEVVDKEQNNIKNTSSTGDGAMQTCGNSSEKVSEWWAICFSRGQTIDEGSTGYVKVTVPVWPERNLNSPIGVIGPSLVLTNVTLLILRKVHR